MSLGHPSKFKRVSRLGFVTAPTSLSGGQPNFAQCLASLARTEILPGAKFTLHPSLVFSYIGSVTARHWSCRRQPNVVVLGLVMAALRSRYGHYIGPVSFFFFFPPLISAVVDWMSTVLNVVWPYSPTLECRSLEMQYPKIRYLGTVAQLCRAISSQLRHVSTKLCDGVQMANFCVLCFQWAMCSTFQTCILNSQYLSPKTRFSGPTDNISVKIIMSDFQF